MNNPWLEISLTDYENHMTKVSQMQVLNELTKECLEKYKPENFALLGCSGGNGLEHIKNEITEKVYAIDINPEYLAKVRNKYEKTVTNLITLNIDLRNDDLTIKNIDLLFAGLILEYLEPEKALSKILKTLRKEGILLIVIQKTKQTSFVSKTKYKSLEKLSTVSKEVNEGKLTEFLSQKNMILTERKEIKLNENKSFVVLSLTSIPKSYIV
jgi:SAM-dependent methyltransferase